MNTHILLIECSDQKGLIHTITSVLLLHGLNIISNNEFVDHDSGQFYMRTVVEGEMNSNLMSAELCSVLPPGTIVRIPTPGKRRVVIMATKEYHCLGDLLLRSAFNELNATIAAVIANNEILAALVKRFDIPFYYIAHEDKSKPEHENEILATLQLYNPEYIILAKYMRILSPEFIANFRNRIINIHHSFLPAFVGASPYCQAFQRGVKIIGATAHYVTEVLDEGPIIAQSVIPIDHTYNVSDMVQAGRDVEKTVLAKALNLVFDERVFLCGKRTVILI